MTPSEVRNSKKGKRVTSTSVEFKDSNQSLSATLREVARSLPSGKIQTRDLLAQVGEQGLLLLCLLLCLPFILPVSIPGVSTVFGIVIILLGASITLNRLPWLPGFVMKRQLTADDLKAAFEKGADTVARMERFVRPRMLTLSQTRGLNILHGLGLTLGGILLLFPLSLIPFSNTLPGLAVIFLAIGMLQRDGVFIVIGHLLNLLSILYFGALFVAAVLAGQGIMSLIGS